MQDGRNIARMTAVILPLPTSSKNSSNHLQQKEKPEIPVQILKFDKISGVFWEITHVGIMLLRWRSSRVPKDDIPIPLNYIPEDDCPMFDLLGCFETNKNKLWCIQEATIDDYWHMDGDKSLSEPWISVTRFALLNKNLPEGYMCVQGRLTKKQVTTRRGTVRPEESSNMSKGSQRTAKNQWLKKNQSWTRQENNEAFTAFRTILIMKKSLIMPQEIWKTRRVSAMPCKITTPAHRNSPSRERPCASELSEMETLHVHSTQEHGNMVVESRRFRMTQSTE